MNKHKRSKRTKPWNSDLNLGCGALLMVSVCFLLSFLMSAFSGAAIIVNSLHAPAPYHQPDIIETLKLPVNSDRPILTRHEYTGWVNVTITGAIDLAGGQHHDAEKLCDAAGRCKPYKGLRIDGEYYNVYGRDLFSHDGYEFLYHVDGDAPRPIAFQLVTEGYPAATGALEVEVFFPWHSFGRGGR